MSHTQLPASPPSASLDLGAVDAALQAWIDTDCLPGVSYLILRGAQVVGQNCLGWADREARIPLRSDHLFRIFSNTKLVTSCAVLQLMEQGRCTADDPVAQYLPALGQLRVLRPGATTLADTVPAREPVRIRHLLTHTAGFTYGFLAPDSPIARAYAAARISDPALDLAQMTEALGQLPLLFEPGTAWNYSVATDVLGRLVEVVSGEPLDRYFHRHIFAPLGMRDTFFVVPPQDAQRLVALYVGDLREPQRPGLRRADALPYDGAYRNPVPRLNAGGGLVCTRGDYARLVGALLQGGAPLLQPSTLRLALDNQLPAGRWIGCPGIPGVAGRGHSFAGAVTVEPLPGDLASVEGELQWGGLAGTKWCISPRENLAVVLMTQRFMGSDLPFWPEFMRGVRNALG